MESAGCLTYKPGEEDSEGEVATRMTLMNRIIAYQTNAYTIFYFSVFFSRYYFFFTIFITAISGVIQKTET